jgi:hypothetical protein
MLNSKKYKVAIVLFLLSIVSTFLNGHVYGQCSNTSNAYLPNYAERYNDNEGITRLRVWVHKVWSRSGCIDGLFNDADYTFKDINVRTRRPNGAAFDEGIPGLTMHFSEAGSNKWHGVNTATEVFNLFGLIPLESPTTRGYKIYDRLFVDDRLPASFQWKVAEAWEEDCGFWFLYETGGLLCLFGILQDDDFATQSYKWATSSFRGINKGEVGYIQEEFGRLCCTVCRFVGNCT